MPVLAAGPGQVRRLARVARPERDERLGAAQQRFESIVADDLGVDPGRAQLFGGGAVAAQLHAGVGQQPHACPASRWRCDCWAGWARRPAAGRRRHRPAEATVTVRWVENPGAAGHHPSPSGRCPPRPAGPPAPPGAPRTRGTAGDDPRGGLHTLSTRGFRFQHIADGRGEPAIIVGTYGWPGFSDRIEIHGEHRAPAARRPVPAEEARCSNQVTSYAAKVPLAPVPGSPGTVDESVAPSRQ